MKLRWLILIAFVGVTLIPVAFLGIWPQSKALQNEVDRVSDQHVLLARHLKLAMERYYRDVVSVFELLVGSALSSESPVGANRLMDNLNFAHICVANVSDGRMVHTVGPMSAPCPATIPQQRLAVFMSIAQEGRTVLTGVLPNPKGDPTIYLVQRRGDLVAVGAINTNYLRALGKAVAFGKRGHAAIVDQHGHVIAHPLDEWVMNRKDISKVPPVQRMMKGETGISKFYSPALKDDMIAGFTTVAGPGWGVMIPQPFSELQAKADSIQLFALAVIMGGFLIALAVAWFFTGYLIGPIAAMSVAASRLSDGVTSARAEFGAKRAPFELRNLLNRFNSMAETIQRNHVELEERVEERTRELGQREHELRNAHDELERRIEERTQDLRASEARFKDFADASADWFWEMDADLRFSYLSENALSLVGASPEWHYGETREEILGDDYDHDSWTNHLKDLQEHRPFRNFEYLHAEEGIEPRWFRTSGIPLFGEDGAFKGYRGSASDITEQKRAEVKLHASEEQLRQAQKMDAVGQLTGGVAHDFNNLLHVILGTAELLDEEFREKLQEQKADRLQPLIRAAQRGAQLTDRLLAFSRKQALRPRAIDIGELFGEMYGLLSRSLGETIEIETTAAPALWTATADPGQLESAILNLAINARDAMPDGGTLTFEWTNATLDRDFVARNPGATAGDYVGLAVSDTGTGMPKEAMERAFEPFFTTKPVGEGTGLGLSMVYGFAKQSGGYVTLDSEEGVGTTVMLYLPRAGIVEERAERSGTNPLPAGRGEVVLVLEDDTDVRSLVVRILGGLDYRVIDAPDGQAALAVLSAGERVDLLLSDVVLPGGMNGPELAQIAKQRDPTLKVMFMSGYASVSTNRNSFPAAETIALNKPFRARELAEKVRAELDR